MSNNTSSIEELSEQELENVAGGSCGKSTPTPPVPEWKQWREKAFTLGYMYYVDVPCNKCHAVSDGIYSWYARVARYRGDHYAYKNDPSKYYTYDELWCFNCNQGEPFLD